MGRGTYAEMLRFPCPAGLVVRASGLETVILLSRSPVPPSLHKRLETLLRVGNDPEGGGRTRETPGGGTLS